MAKSTPAQLRAYKKYNATACRQVHLKLNKKTDADVLQQLEKQDSMQGYIKALIRDDIAKEGQ